ncbi:hypothetical protein [Paracoccus benzoatiresistens]|uniref:Uncharacterized protein n=1 Tax=Paracoccus benzoatiresistens TaxID=2997341 RepID=A0ABT4JAT4_9RHOB|nr:hypothetical protein [Paracoccus sp. EF6]MCZ0963458.1 hypothetical protein [Paracoccus sp. EF6]
MHTLQKLLQDCDAIEKVIDLKRKDAARAKAASHRRNAFENRATGCKLHQCRVVIKAGASLDSFIAVSSFDITKANQETTYRCDVHDASGRRELRYVVSSTTGHRKPSETANWAAMALLLPAMLSGKALNIQGSVSALLLHFLRSDLQDLLMHFNSSLKRIDVEADIAPAEGRSCGALRVGTGFSAGIDSFSALRSFRQSGVSACLDVTDLMTFGVGAFGESGGRGTEEAFTKAAARTAAYAQELGVEAHSVRSNLTHFYDRSQGLGFTRTHTLRNASAASLFERELDIYLYASAFAYPELDLTATDYMGHLDPVLLPLLSTTDLRFISAGAGSDRIRKTELLADDTVAQGLLDVCVTPPLKRAAMVGPGRNCSQCWKCYRTMLTLDALGKLERFAAIFDLEYYHQNKAGVLRTLRQRGQKGSKLDKAAVDLYLASPACNHPSAHQMVR